MVNAVPASEAVALYNEATLLPFGADPQIGRIIWRLRALVRARPSDFALKVALGYACAKAGDAKEAQRLSDEVRHSRFVLEDQVRATFALQTLNLGHYERFLEMRFDPRTPVFFRMGPTLG